jgi:fructokinase
MDFDVLALGELLIDFTPAGVSPAGNALFERNPGGGPPNMLVALSRLGGRAAFIGKVGDDQFGRFLKAVLETNNIDVRGLRFTNRAGTTLAIVHLEPDGNRSFSFYRKPGADILLSADDVDLSLVGQCRVFHFSSLSMTDEPSRSATMQAVLHAKELGKIISYDPNWRPLLWESDAAAKKGMQWGLEYADVLKVSDSELEFLTGEADMTRAADKLFGLGIKTVLVTLGPDGCYFRCKAGAKRVPAFSAEAVDTTGAGDAFLGGFLFRLCRAGKRPEELGAEETAEMVRFSNAVGSICTTRRGGIPAMPSLQEVEHRMQTAGRDGETGSC